MSGDEVQYLLRAEQQLLQSITGRAPLSQLLHRICEALDSEIGNMISLISLAKDDTLGPEGIARSATVFGLHKFCSAGVVDGNGRNLGSLEMYCGVARRPHLDEVQLIERATWLAAVAIERHKEAGIGRHPTDSCSSLAGTPSESVVQHDAQE